MYLTWSAALASKASLGSSVSLSSIKSLDSSVTLSKRNSLGSSVFISRRTSLSSSLPFSRRASPENSVIPSSKESLSSSSSHSNNVVLTVDTAQNRSCYLLVPFRGNGWWRLFEYITTKRLNLCKGNYFHLTMTSFELTTSGAYRLASRRTYRMELRFFVSSSRR